MKTQILALDLLKLDAGTQNRIRINEEAVEDYVELIRAANGEWPFGPLDVFHDGTDYMMADGFHRTLAANKAKRASVPCRVHQGTAHDARIFGMTANDKHGLRMTRADKRVSVKWLLDNGGKLTQKEISEKAGVGQRLVQTIIAERKGSVVTKPAQPVGGKALNASPPKSVESYGLDHDPFAEVNAGYEESASVESGDKEPPSRPSRNGKDKPAGPPKQYDRSFWLKQWENQIGPLVRLVDKIAAGVGESQGKSHRCTQQHLELATEEMMEWMKVK